MYLLHSNGFYKIGRTSNPIKARLSSIQTGNPHKVELVHLLENLTHKQSIKVEQELHIQFKHLCTSGEWFKLAQEDLFECINIMESTTPEQDPIEKASTNIKKNFNTLEKPTKPHIIDYVDLEEILPDNCLWTDITTTMLMFGGSIIMRRMYVYKEDFDRLGANAPLYYCAPTLVNKSKPCK